MTDYHAIPNVQIGHNLINGRLVPWGGATARVATPLVAGTAIGSHPLSDAATALAALGSCCDAWGAGRGAWPTASASIRLTALLAIAHEMEARAGELARLIVWEIAKTVADAEKEVSRTIEYIRATVAAAAQVDEDGARIQQAPPVAAMVRRAPLGVILCMGPFNYPLNETLCTLIPALAMGNCCLVKPPRLGVLVYGAMAEIFQRHLPPGVINIVFGEGRVVANAAMADGRVDSLAFIGSSRTANALLKLHPMPNRLRPILGLEAKNPAIVTAHADLELAADEIMTGAFSYNGQRCTALKLVLAERTVAGRLEKLLAERVRELGRSATGSPLTPGVRVTPLAEPDKPAFLQKMIEEAVSLGGRLVAGGEADGQLLAPTLVADTPQECRLWREEQFGPVLPLAAYDTIEDVFAYIAASQYGQQASLFTSDGDEAVALTRALLNQVCRINLNSQCQRGPDQLPFTGRKDSAVGTLSVGDALRCFSIRTLVAAPTGSDTMLEKIVADHRGEA